MLTIAMTGGIGCGKTTVSKLFKDLGIEVIDTDIIARDLTQPGLAGYKAIVERYSEEITLPDGQIDRMLLRNKIFKSAAERKWLENLLHPLIRAAWLHRIPKVKSAYVVVVIPLLVETGLDASISRVLLIDTPKELQISRTMERDKISAEQVADIMASQTTREERLSIAKDVIVNDGTMESLKAQVEELHKKYTKLS